MDGSPATPCPGFEELRAESRRIGAVLGEARDCYVFVETLRADLLPRFGAEPGFDSLLRAAQAKADAGRGRAPSRWRQSDHALRARPRAPRGRARLAERGGGRSASLARGAGRRLRRKESRPAGPEGPQARPAFRLAHAGEAARVAHRAQAPALRDRVFRLP